MIGAGGAKPTTPVNSPWSFKVSCTQLLRHGLIATSVSEIRTRQLL